MSPEFYVKNALAPALSLLPPKMDSQGARAMIVAICLQESRIKYRAQIGGPARSYGQFELGGGVRAVLTNNATKPHIQAVLAALDYPADSSAEACWRTIEHNDILGAAFARLLLWALPQPLPTRDEFEESWTQYTEAWRPGKPHPETWNAFYKQAWELTDKGEEP